VKALQPGSTTTHQHMRLPVWFCRAALHVRLLVCCGLLQYFAFVAHSMGSTPEAVLKKMAKVYGLDLSRVDGVEM
jgi:hypothetical protein